MVLKLKIAAFALALIYGIWLAFQPREGMLYGSWNCAASKSLFCIQK